MSAFGFGPSLALRHRRAVSAMFDFAGTVPAGATLTRASAGVRFDAAGSLVGAAANVARFDYDAATLALRGLLVEGAATNLLLSSEAFDAAAWTNAGSSVTANAAASPAGTTTAEKLVESSGTGQHRTQQTIATTVGQAYGYSVFVKAAERSSVWLRLSGASTYAAATFDLGAGTISGVIGTAAIVPLAGGWWRVAVSGVADAASTIVYLNLADAGGNGGYTGNGSAGLLVWGAQGEAGAVSTYVATAGAAASRAADVVTLDWGSRAVPDGTPTVRYTFDDGSTQDLVTAIAGGVAAVPTTLARARVRRAAVV